MARASAILPLAALASGYAAGLLGLPAPGWAVDVLLVLLVAVAGADIAVWALMNRGGLVRGAAAGALLAALGAAASAAGGAAAALALGDPVRAGAALGAASGWYTLAGPLLASTHGAAMGLTALLANQLREALHIAVYPLLARRGHRLAAVALGGATTMDTGLPVILAHGGPGEAAAAMVQGLLLTLSAPALLPLLLG